MQDQGSEVQIHPANYRFLQEHVYLRYCIVLAEDNHCLVETRLRPLVEQLGLNSINDLCAFLQ